MLGQFESAKLLISRAKGHTRDLEVRVKRFADSKPYALVIEHDPQTEEYAHKVRLGASRAAPEQSPSIYPNQSPGLT
jgi:hypothetical protein